MTTKEKLIKLAQSQIGDCSVIKVEDFGDAYAIYFQDNRYLETRDRRYLSAGAGPLIYIKETEQFYRTSSGNSPEHYLQAYRECGDIYGELSDSVLIRKLPDVGSLAQNILTLKKILKLDHKKAREMVEELDNERDVAFTLSDHCTAEVIVEQLREIGFEIKHLWKPSQERTAPLNVLSSQNGEKGVR